MAKKGPREMITLQCSQCKKYNYHSSKNKRNTPDKLEIKKLCRSCGGQTVHKELKK